MLKWGGVTIVTPPHLSRQNDGSGGRYKPVWGARILNCESASQLNPILNLNAFDVLKVLAVVSYDHMRLHRSQGYVMLRFSRKALNAGR